jgi:hypothetical protein
MIVVCTKPTQAATEELVLIRLGGLLKEMLPIRDRRSETDPALPPATPRRCLP